MSNIARKITKKYKWLRFFNKKVTKLSVLGASLVGLCISTGASFAKYRNENYGNGAAGIATIGTADLNYYMLRTEVLASVAEIGLYAFIANFDVYYSSAEVTRQVTIDLRLSNMNNVNFTADNSYDPEITTFGIQSETEGTYTDDLYTLKNVTDDKDTTDTSDDVTTSELQQISSLEDLSGDTSDVLKTVKYNTVYYAHSIEDGSYTWNSKSLSSMYNFQIVKEESIGMAETTHHFKVIYFIYLDKDENDTLFFKTENSQILFHLVLEQTGGSQS